MSGALGWARIVRTSTVRRYQAIVEESGSPNGRAGQMCATSTRAAPSGGSASKTIFRFVLSLRCVALRHMAATKLVEWLA